MRRTRSALAGSAAALALAMVSGCEIKANIEDQVTIVGRVFAAQAAKPLPNAEVELPDGTKTKTDAEGRFVVKAKRGSAGSLKAGKSGFAPTSKSAPAGDGYVELYAKEADAKAMVTVSKGGSVAAPKGGSVSLPSASLVDTDDKAAESAKVEVALPDPRKSTDLPAIPGNFDAKVGSKKGKVSTESPMYVRASDGDKELKLGKGKSAGASFPARQAGGDDEPQLFHFDEETQTWEAHGKARRSSNKAALPGYEAELDALGWWAVGEFYDRLTCVRACVVDKDGEGVPYARAVATGIDHFTQVTTYADEEGCFALDLRADAQVSLTVQAIDGFVPSREVATPSTEASAADGASKCEDLGKLELQAPSGDDECPLGLRACGDACVDIRSDRENCGECGNACGGTDGRELACVEGLCGCPLGQTMCTGGGSSIDNGNDTPDTTDPGGRADAGVDVAPAESCVGYYADYTFGSLDEAVVRGACNSTEDVRLVCENDLITQSANAGGKCFGQQGAARRTCLDTELSRFGLSDGCTTCAVDQVECTLVNCASACVNATSASCLSCRTEFGCDPGFYECSGLPTPKIASGGTDGAGAQQPAPRPTIRAQTVTYCTSVREDPLNCGGCNMPCASGLSCVDGACTQTSTNPDDRPPSTGGDADAGKPTDPVKTECTSDDECGSGLVCSADGRCVPGASVGEVTCVLDGGGAAGCAQDSYSCQGHTYSYRCSDGSVYEYRAANVFGTCQIRCIANGTYQGSKCDYEAQLCGVDVPPDGLPCNPGCAFPPEVPKVEVTPIVATPMTPDGGAALPPDGGLAGGCGAGQFQCMSGDCIDMALTCNMEPDCFDGSDELVQAGCPVP